MYTYIYGDDRLLLRVAEQTCASLSVLRMKSSTDPPSLRSMGAQAVPYSCSSVLKASKIEDSPTRELVPRLLPASFRLPHHCEKKPMSGSKYCHDKMGREKMGKEKKSDKKK